MKKRIVLIDGDLVLNQSCNASARSVDWGDGTTSRGGDLSDAVHNAKTRIETLVNHCIVGHRKHELILCFSDPSRRYFRHDIWEPYKAPRGVRDPVPFLKELRVYLEEEYTSRWYPTLEADDVLGILQDHYNARGDEPVLVSCDKDMKQIPGLHLNDMKVDAGLFVITEQQAHEFFLTQTITGDSTDNYPGCPGIGPKRAAKYVARGWDGVVEAFESRGLCEEDALVQARVARILRLTDWDSKEKKIKRLWCPENPAHLYTKENA
jgi:5'-3' exonuclease